MRAAFLVLLLYSCGDDSGTLVGGDAAVDAAVDARGPAVLVIAPVSQDFGDVPISNASNPAMFTVRNVGSVAVDGLALTAHGSGQLSFAITQNTCATLAVGASCTVGIAFAPTRFNGQSASFEVGAPGVTSVFAAVSGNGYNEPGPLVVSGFVHDFGPVGLAQTASYTFTVSQSSGMTQTLAASISGADAAAFTIAQDSCTGMAIPANGTCTIQVRFHDTSIGARTAELRVAKSNGYYSRLLLRGEIVSGDGRLFANASTITFPNDPVGSSDAAASFGFTNNSATTTAPLALAVTGTTSEFPFSSDTCSGAALATGDSCWVSLRFAPTSVGAKLMTVAVVGTAASVTLRGASSFFTVSPIEGGEFYELLVGEAGIVRTMVFTNVGAATFSPVSVMASGPDVSQFHVTSDTCTGATLAPNGTCALSFTFVPTTPGKKSAAYDVSAAGAGSISVALSGTALLP